MREITHTAAPKLASLALTNIAADNNFSAP
jgi:hypothetical protein